MVTQLRRWAFRPGLANGAPPQLTEAVHSEYGGVSCPVLPSRSLGPALCRVTGTWPSQGTALWSDVGITGQGGAVGRGFQGSGPGPSCLPARPLSRGQGGRGGRTEASLSWLRLVAASPWSSPWSSPWDGCPNSPLTWDSPRASWGLLSPPLPPGHPAGTSTLPSTQARLGDGVCTAGGRSKHGCPTEAFSTFSLESDLSHLPAHV